jgi:hypothetical protein
MDRRNPLENTDVEFSPKRGDRRTEYREFAQKELDLLNSWRVPISEHYFQFELEEEDGTFAIVCRDDAEPFSDLQWASVRRVDMNGFRVLTVLLFLGSTGFCQTTNPSVKTPSSPAPERKWAFGMSVCKFPQTPWSIDGLTSLLVPIPEKNASGVHTIPLSQIPNVYLHRIPRNTSCRQMYSVPAVPVSL